MPVPRRLHAPLELQFAQIPLEQFSQLGRFGKRDGVAFHPQQILVAKFCERSRERFTGGAHFGSQHAFGTIELDLIVPNA
jgi:hypothetical protein